MSWLIRVTTDLYDRIRLAYQEDENYTPLVQFFPIPPMSQVQYLEVDPRDPPRVVVPNDEDLKYDILLEAHDAPTSGHLGREKTYQMVSQTFWWSRMYKWVAHYVKTCETCQRMKPSGHASALLKSLPVPADCWKSRKSLRPECSLVEVYDILLEAHDAPTSGHLGREKTYQMVSQTFWWSR
ncbi:LOW QUALITY PROTEIN: Pol protein, partial [Phytophthora palmivora]